MATEILNLPYFCITQIMVKEATNPKPSMQREWYCLAVQKYTRERTFEYVGAEKQTAEKVGFRHRISYKERTRATKPGSHRYASGHTHSHYGYL